MVETTAAATTAERIIAAARELLSVDGIEGVTMRRVAAEVGITPMALYRHFPNRDGLLNALADEGFAGLSEKLNRLRLTGEPERQLIRILDVFLDHAFEKPRLFELMFLTKREGARRFPEDFKAGRSPTANASAEVLARGMETAHFAKDDVWEIVFETGALVQGLVMLYLGGRVSMTPSQFRAFCHRSFGRYMNGIRS
ncbi:MAG: TetR/AcrR family transcriptional regulator [Acidobacteria bacterium]|nr:TetR/AcrR family transcriptional regulator [Acidobacteriota bacterium]